MMPLISSYDVIKVRQTCSYRVHRLIEVEIIGDTKHAPGWNTNKDESVATIQLAKQTGAYVSPRV